MNSIDRHSVTTDCDNVAGALRRFRQTDDVAALWQCVNTIVPLLAIIAAAVLVRDRSDLSYYALVACGALWVQRAFALMHDCVHNSFVSGKTLNFTIGRTIGMLLITPFDDWRRSHEFHHAHAGVLPLRNNGYFPVLTVNEFKRVSVIMKGLYRVYRFPLVLLICVPLLQVFVLQRMTWTRASNSRASVWCVNAYMLGICGMIVFGGCWSIFEAYVAILVVGACLGNIVLLAQHTFEGAVTRLDDGHISRASVIASTSVIQCPSVVAWFLANANLHYVHHLDPSIPNYCLPDAHEAIREAVMPHSIGVRRLVMCATLSLIDDRNGRYVTFRETTCKV